MRTVMNWNLIEIYFRILATSSTLSASKSTLVYYKIFICTIVFYVLNINQAARERYCMLLRFTVPKPRSMYFSWSTAVQNFSKMWIASSELTVRVWEWKHITIDDNLTLSGSSSIKRHIESEYNLSIVVQIYQLRINSSGWPTPDQIWVLSKDSNFKLIILYPFQEIFAGWAGQILSS